MKKTDDTIGTPLSSKIATPTVRHKSLRKQWKVKRQPRPQSGQKLDSTRPLGTKTKVVTLTPHQKFTNDKEVAEDTGNNQQLVRVKTEKHVANGNDRSQRCSRKKQGLNKVDATLG